MAKRPEGVLRARSPLAHVALLALMTTTAGCAAQSEMADLWRDPSYASGPMHTVLVVAPRKDPVRRRMWEDAFAGELGARGVTATSSYQLFPEASPDSQAVLEAIRRTGFEAVLTSVRLPNRTTSTYVPGLVRRESMMARDLYGTLRTYWRDVQDPGHTETDEIRRFQTDVWATGDGGRLIWSGTLRTLESVSNRTIETAVTRSILPVLEKQALIPKKE